jgi:amino acid permease
MSIVIASGSSVAIIFYIIVGVFAYATFSSNEG